MANNGVYAEHAQSRTWTNGTGADISSGDIVVMGALGNATLGLASVDIANGASGSVLTNLTVTAPKVSAAVFKQGESLIWDSSVDAFDDNAATPASGDVTGSCRADEDGANTETTCTVFLTGIPGTLTA